MLLPPLQFFLSAKGFLQNQSIQSQEDGNYFLTSFTSLWEIRNVRHVSYSFYNGINRLKLIKSHAFSTEARRDWTFVAAAASSNSLPVMPPNLLQNGKELLTNM